MKGDKTGLSVLVFIVALASAINDEGTPGKIIGLSIFFLLLIQFVCSGPDHPPHSHHWDY